MAAPLSPPAIEPGFEYLGRVQDVALPEISGLAYSRRTAGFVWAISDSGNRPELVALDKAPGVAGTVRVEGVVNHDWEDLAAFELDGEPWLLIADIGDNFALRSEVSLILVREPEPGATSVAPARVIRFQYADGPRDSESVAVDVPGRRVLLADKGLRPPGLYELALDGADSGRSAVRIGDFPPLVSTPAPRVQSIGGPRWRGTPTAMDVSRDGRRLAVLTDLSATIFDRAPGQDWAAALKHPSLNQRLPRIPRFEALALAPDQRSALIANEAPVSHFYLWTLPVPPSEE
ncbi:MAG: hypothetical protein ACT4PZ_14745 [Panacagrimonas sp.]